MVKTYYKVVRRMFKKQFTRLLSLIGIILISVGFVSGIGSPTDMIKDSIENYYKKQNVSDFIIKSKTGRFTQEEIDKIKNHFGQENVETGMSFDIKTGEKKSLRLYFLDFDKWNINVPELVEGEKINKDDKNLVYVEAKDNKINGYNIGEKIEISLKDALNLPFEYTTIARALVIVAGYMGSVPLMMLFTAVAALGQGPWQGDMNAVIAECSEYTYLTQGKRVDGTMYSCTSLGIKIGGGIGTAIVGWLLEISGYVGTNATQPTSAITMLQVMYLWLPFVFEILITILLSKMNVEAANEKLRREKGIE